MLPGSPCLWLNQDLFVYVPDVISCCFHTESYELQAAALGASQYLATEVRVCMQRGSEAATPASDGSLPSPMSSSNKTGSKPKKLRPPSPPLSPLVGQLTEMGFARRVVECAIKFFGETRFYC